MMHTSVRLPSPENLGKFYLPLPPFLIKSRRDGTREQGEFPLSSFFTLSPLSVKPFKESNKLLVYGRQKGKNRRKDEFFHARSKKCLPNMKKTLILLLTFVNLRC